MLILPFLYFFVNAAETQRMCKQKAVSNLVQRPKKRRGRPQLKQLQWDSLGSIGILAGILDAGLWKWIGNQLINGRRLAARETTAVLHGLHLHISFAYLVMEASYRAINQLMLSSISTFLSTPHVYYLQRCRRFTWRSLKDPPGCTAEHLRKNPRPFLHSTPIIMSSASPFFHFDETKKKRE